MSTITISPIASGTVGRPLYIGSTRTPRRNRSTRRTGAATISRHIPTTCGDCGKLRYRDRHQATDALNAARRQRSSDLIYSGRTTRREVRAYKCEACRGWHLTSLAEWLTADGAGSANESTHQKGEDRGH